MEEAPDVDAVVERVANELEPAGEVAHPLVVLAGVVAGADPELADQQRPAGQLGVKAVEHGAQPLGPDRVTEW